MALKSNLAQRVPPTLEEFKLPSAGIPYLAKYPKFPETVKIAPYSAMTEAVLTTSLSATDKMAEITRRVATNIPQGFDINSLLVTDQFFIIAVARALTYGEVYKFPAPCPACDYNYIAQVKVPAEIPTVIWDRAKPPHPEVTLPVIKDLVSLKFLTVGEDNEINRFQRDLVAKKSSDVAAEEQAYIRRLASHIDAVGGGRPDNIGEADDFIRNLSGADIVELQNAIRTQASGIKFEWTVSCDRCGHLYEKSIPIAADFFRRNRVGHEDAKAISDSETREHEGTDVRTEHARTRATPTP